MVNRNLEHTYTESWMVMLIIRCPRTRREVSTGIKIEPENFKTLPVFFSRSFCPICRVEHEWFAQEAWVSEDEMVE